MPDVEITEPDVILEALKLVALAFVAKIFAQVDVPVNCKVLAVIPAVVILDTNKLHNVLVEVHLRVLVEMFVVNKLVAVPLINEPFVIEADSTF